MFIPTGIDLIPSIPADAVNPGLDLGIHRPH